MQMYLRPFQIRGPTRNVAPQTSSQTVSVANPDGSTEGNRSIRLMNVGANIVFVNFGTSSSITASTGSGYPLPPNTMHTLFLPRNITHMACIANNPSSTLYYTLGESE